MAYSGYNCETIGHFHLHMVPHLMREYGIKREEIVVDIGAGQGHGLIPLYKAGFKHLIAIDIDDWNFAMFRDRFGFECHQCDVENDNLPIQSESVAAVLSFHVIEHLFSPDHYLSEIYRILGKGRYMFLVTPDWRKQFKTFYRDPNHLRPYDKESIARLLRMHNFNVSLFSWGTAYGLGRLKCYVWFTKLGMIGQDILAIGIK